MKNSILVALNDSVSSRKAIEFLAGLSICAEDLKITLVHVFRRQSASEELMGEKYTKRQPSKYLKTLENARDALVAGGYRFEDIALKIVTDPYATVADGIIDQFRTGDYNVVVIGRKRMSKAEEFVMGDVGVKLVRALEGVAVIVVKS